MRKALLDLYVKARFNVVKFEKSIALPLLRGKTRFKEVKFEKSIA